MQRSGPASSDGTGRLLTLMLGVESDVDRLRGCRRRRRQQDGSSFVRKTELSWLGTEKEGATV